MEHRINDIFLARNLARLRKSRKMTQTQLAERLFISNKTVSKWERGIGYPELPQLLRLSDLFGVSMDALIRGERHGIAIAGNILCDEVKMIEDFPERGMLVNINAMSRAVGGCVPNTAISLAKIDPTLSLLALGKRGNDAAGDYVVREMLQCGIDVSGVTLSNSHPTGFSDVMTSERTGERTFFHHRGANTVFSPSDISVGQLPVKMLHIGYIHLLDAFDAPDSDYGTVMARFLHDVKACGISTSIDVVSRRDELFAEKVIAALPYTNNVILNEVEACGVAGIVARDANGKLIPSNIRTAMEIILSHGVGERVIVHCPEAGFCLRSDGAWTAVPSLRLPSGYIKGTVGAGDAFCAGCLYSIYHDADDGEMLKFAAGAAACNLSAADSVSGMRSASHIRELIRTYQTPEQSL